METKRKTAPVSIDGFLDAMPRNCVTHHWACDCREAKFKLMAEALRELLADSQHSTHYCGLDGDDKDEYGYGCPVEQAKAVLVAYDKENA